MEFLIAFGIFVHALYTPFLHWNPQYYFNPKPQQLIKYKLLLSIYSQLHVESMENLAGDLLLGLKFA